MIATALPGGAREYAVLRCETVHQAAHRGGDAVAANELGSHVRKHANIAARSPQSDEHDLSRPRRQHVQRNVLEARSLLVLPHHQRVPVGLVLEYLHARFRTVVR